MGYVVLPALVADISAVYDVYFAAFRDNAITRALFPSATVQDLMNPDSEFRYVNRWDFCSRPLNVFASTPPVILEVALLIVSQ